MQPVDDFLAVFPVFLFIFARVDQHIISIGAGAEI
jgi:hypothetical protein